MIHINPLLKIQMELAVRGMPRLCVAYSGGLDSRFLCFAAMRAGADVLAVHFKGPHIPAAETEEALDFAEKFHLPLVTLDFDPLHLPDIADNTKNRCYACKKAILSAMKAHLTETGQEGRTPCDGSNFDDLSVFRPGRRALEEEHIWSPLAECRITKQDIREIAATVPGLMPALGPRPCLLTRYQYGLHPTKEELARIARAETALAALRNSDGTPVLGDFRLRITPAAVLQVTSTSPDEETAVRTVLEENGFPGFSIAVTETVSGYFDKTDNPARS